MQGPAEALRDVLLTGRLGATRLTGPVTSGWSRRCEERADLVGERDPGPPLAARAHRAAEPEPPQAQQRRHGAAVGCHDDAGAERARPRPRRRRRAGPPPPRPGTTSARKSLPGRAGLGELLVTAVAVVADGRADDEAHRVVGLGDRTRPPRCVRVDARGDDLALVLGVQPLVADADAGEVDDAVDVVECRRVEGAARTGPTAPRRPSRRAPDQTRTTVVAALTSGGDERRRRSVRKTR